MSSLTKRLISALIAASIVLGSGYLAGAPAVFYLSALMMLLGLKEFGVITFSQSHKCISLNFFAHGLIYLAFLVIRPSFVDDVLAPVLISYICFGLALSRSQGDQRCLMRDLSIGLLGLIYAVFLPGFVLSICRLPDGLFWFYHLLFIVFIGDTFAYFGGKLFGKVPLMPFVSPKKTVEGSLSGLLGSMLTGALLLFFKFDHPSIALALGYPLLTGLVAQNGDLLASLVKRVANVKDSGSIMPGHGGILDRLDGVYLAAPVVYLFARSFN